MTISRGFISPATCRISAAGVSNAGVDREAVELRSLASESTAQLLTCQLMLADVQNVEGRSLDLAEHLCHGQRRQRLLRAVERNEDDGFAHGSSACFPALRILPEP